MTPVVVQAFGRLLRRDMSAAEVVPGRAVYRQESDHVAVRAAFWPSTREPRWHVSARLWDPTIGLEVAITGSARTLFEAEEQVIERARQHAPLLHQLIHAAESRSTSAA